MVQNIQNARLIVKPNEGRAAQFQYATRFLKHAVHSQEA